MNTPIICCVCDQPATVEDTEYADLDWFCEEHAEFFKVYDGPHRKLEQPS